MNANDRAGVDRRSGKDRRKRFKLSSLLPGGRKRSERRSIPERRTVGERRKEWVRISKWSSVLLEKLKIAKYLK